MSEILSSTTKTITWKIRNINKDLFTGDEANEEKFSIHFTLINDDHYTEWNMSFQAMKGDIGFFLHLKDSSTKDFKTDFHVNLVSSKSETTIKKSGKVIGQGFQTEFDKFGWGAFVKKGQLLQRYDDFVVNETLTFSCSLTVHLPLSEDKVEESSYQTFFASYKNLFQNENFSDFKIESSDGKVFNCHKVILALKSEVFEKMLTSEMKETREGICKIKDFDSKIVEAMLKYIYFQKIPNLDEIASKLISAAEKYGLKELKNLCIANMVQNLREENVIEALKICDKISDCDFLYKKCVAVVLKNWPEIMGSGGCKSLSNEILLKLYKSHVDALMTVIEVTTK